MALAVADVADEPPRNGRLLPVKRVGAGTAEVRGSIARPTDHHFGCGGLAGYFSNQYSPSPEP